MGLAPIFSKLNKLNKVKFLKFMNIEFCLEINKIIVSNLNT